MTSSTSLLIGQPCVDELLRRDRLRMVGQARVRGQRRRRGARRSVRARRATIAPQTASTRPGRRVATSASLAGRIGRDVGMVSSCRSCGSMARAGDPGDEDVVGVVDEVVAGEGVDEVALAAQVRGGDGHELAVAGRGRQALGPGEKIVALGGREQRRGDQDRRLVAGARRRRRSLRSLRRHRPRADGGVLWGRRRHGRSIAEGR